MANQDEDERAYQAKPFVQQPETEVKIKPITSSKDICIGLIQRAHKANSTEALNFSRAACNIADAICQLKHAENM
jgi:hypothetical protein